MRESVFVLTLVLCVGSLVYSERPRFSYELSKPGADVELKCPLNPPVHWTKDKVIITDGHHYSINADNGTLNILKVLSGDLVGSYSCHNSSDSRQIVLYAGSVVKKFPERSITLTEGEQLELKCPAWGHPALTVRWRRTDRNDVETELTGSGRVSLGDSDGLRNASLTVADVTLEDYGSYTCIADNGLSYSNNTYNTVTILVRVKGKLTPLWPFIGIIIEIIILITIIIIYENRKSKQTDNDEVKDSGPVANSNDHKDGENVRSRK